MIVTRRMILILVAVSCVSCNKDRQQAKSTKLEIDSTVETFVSEYRSFIEVFEDAEYQIDFDKSIERGDYRFVGIMAYSLIIPGVSDYYEKYDKSNSVKIIEGITGSYEDSVALRIAIFKNEYATAYNQLLLKYLSQEGE